MTENYERKSVTLPNDLISKSTKKFHKSSHKPLNKITFSEVVREALYHYSEKHGR